MEWRKPDRLWQKKASKTRGWAGANARGVFRPSTMTDNAPRSSRALGLAKRSPAAVAWRAPAAGVPPSDFPPSLLKTFVPPPTSDSSSWNPSQRILRRRRPSTSRSAFAPASLHATPCQHRRAYVAPILFEFCSTDVPTPAERHQRCSVRRPSAKKAARTRTTMPCSSADAAAQRRELRPHKTGGSRSHSISPLSTKSRARASEGIPADLNPPSKSRKDPLAVPDAKVVVEEGDKVLLAAVAARLADPSESRVAALRSVAVDRLEAEIGGQVRVEEAR